MKVRQDATAEEIKGSGGGFGANWRMSNMPIKHPREKEDIAHNFGLHYLVSVLSLNRVCRYGAVKKDLLTHLYGGDTSLIENRLTPNTTMDDTNDGAPPLRFDHNSQRQGHSVNVWGKVAQDLVTLGLSNQGNQNPSSLSSHHLNNASSGYRSVHPEEGSAGPILVLTQYTHK